MISALPIKAVIAQNLENPEPINPVMLEENVVQKEAVSSEKLKT